MEKEADINSMMESRIREMATEGMDEWMERRRAKVSRAVTMASVAVAAVLPVVSYACAPSPGYRSYRSSSESVNIKEIQQAARTLYTENSNNYTMYDYE